MSNIFPLEFGRTLCVFALYEQLGGSNIWNLNGKVFQICYLYIYSHRSVLGFIAA